MKDLDLAILGRQFLLVLLFEQAGFQPDLEMKDEVLGDKVNSGELFKMENGRWFMRNESIPGDLALKSMAVDSDAAYLETSPFDKEALEQTIKDEMLPFRYDREKLSFIDVTTGDTLATVSEPSTPEFDGEKLGARVLWTMPIKGLEWVRKNALLRLVDSVYNHGCFQADDVAIDTGPVQSMAMAQKLQLRLSMHLQQTLKLEQRPVLALRQTLSQRQILTVRLELTQIMALQHRILKMSPRELEDWVAKDMTPEGQAKALSAMLFTLSGIIKKAQPKLSWSEARKLARSLVSKAGRSRQ